MVHLACLAARVIAVAAAPELTMAATVAAGPPYDEESRTYIQVRPEWPAVHDVPQAIAAAGKTLQQPTPRN